ncbi:MAG: hypothetical protein JXL80_02320 [Planctomycetes bacterium]|nr:hypothetical protein [Planctomycetota bacterium]
MIHARVALLMVMSVVVSAAAPIGCFADGAASPMPTQPPLASTAPGFYALYVDFEWDKGYMEVADDIKATGIRDLLGRVRVGSKAGEAALLRAAQDGMNVTLSLSTGRKAFGQDAEKAMAEYVEHIRRYVGRYGSSGSFWKEHPEVAPRPVRHWLIWGEPNIEMLMPPEGTGRVDLYARILKTASEEVRRLDPAARLIAFNTSDGAPHHGRGLRPDSFYNGYVGWRRFIREVNEKTGTDLYDIVGTHPYHQPLCPEEGGIVTGVKMVRELARKQGFLDKPLWFTEIGYPTVYPGNKQVRDERQQACFLVRMFAISASCGVEQVQVMYVRDIVHAETLPGQGQTQRNFGFFFEPGKWKEQAVATRIMTTLVPDPRREVMTINEEPKGVYAYQFKGLDGLPIVMAWHSAYGQAEERSFNVALDGGKDVTLVDMLGKDIRSLTPTADGKVGVTVSEAPVYIVPAPAERVRAALASSSASDAK